MGKILDKLLLYKMKLIIAKEIMKPYYRDSTNIREVVDLERQRVINMSNKYQTTDYVKNIAIYKNDFVKFNDIISTVYHFPVISSNRVQNKRKV